MNNSSTLIRVAYCAGLVGLGIATFGCSTTGRARKVDESGFLSKSDYALLKKTKGDVAQLLYVNQKADWKAYTKVIVDPITIWRVPGSELEKIPQNELDELGAYFHQALLTQLSQDYEIVTKPSAGTMRIRIALTETDKSNVGLNAVTTIVPIGLAVNYAKVLATGTGTFVGKAAAECEIRSATTDELLAAAVAARVGQKNLTPGKLGSWGDVKNAADTWAANLRERLTEARAKSLNIEYKK